MRHNVVMDLPTVTRRRTLLRVTATAPFSTSAPPSGLGRVVVVGAGSIGQRHLRNLARMGVAVAALRSYRGTAGALPAVPTLTTWGAVREFHPDAVVIATPTALHADTAIQAAEDGYHLLVEKPLAHTLSHARAIQQAVTDAGTVGLVGYHFRHHPTLQQVRAWVREGAIGTPIHARAHWGEYLPGWHPGEDTQTSYSARRDLGGGVVLTLSHTLDYLRWILGEPVEVSAFTTRATTYTVDVEDVAHVSLRLATGGIATVTLDYAERSPRHELHIVGLEGSITWDARSGVARREPAGGSPEVVALPAGFDRNDLFVAELEHFAACVAGHATPTCTVADGVAAVAIAEAALRSSAWGRVVDV